MHEREWRDATEADKRQRHQRIVEVAQQSSLVRQVLLRYPTGRDGLEQQGEQRYQRLCPSATTSPIQRPEASTHKHPLTRHPTHAQHHQLSRDKQQRNTPSLTIRMSQRRRGTRLGFFVSSHISVIVAVIPRPTTTAAGGRRRRSMPAPQSEATAEGQQTPRGPFGAAALVERELWAAG